MTKRCYIVHTSSNYEKRAKRSLELAFERTIRQKKELLQQAADKNSARRVSKLEYQIHEMEERIGEVLLPTETVGNREICQYPGYIFVELNLDIDIDDELSEVEQAAFAHKQREIVEEIKIVVKSADRVSRLGEPLHNTDRMKVTGEEEEEVVQQQHSFTVGQQVRIIRGAFSGVDGTIVDVQDRKLQVRVEMFGRSTPVDIAPENVELSDR
jgi:transcription antitermination factor NusG